MESLINLLGIDLRTFEGTRLRQVLAWIAASLVIVIVSVGLSVFTTLFQYYSFGMSTLTTIFSVFILFHVYRILIVFATTDCLLTREEHQASTASPLNQRSTLAGLPNFLSMFIKYLFLGILSLFFAFFIFFQLLKLFSGNSSACILKGDDGVFGLGIHLFHTLKLIHWLGYVACFILVLLPMLITDVFLDKRLIRQNYRTLHLRALVTDRVRTESAAHNRRISLREEEIRRYLEISDLNRPSIKDLMIGFLNKKFN